MKTRTTQNYIDEGKVREIVFLNLKHDVVEMVILEDGTRVLTKDTYNAVMSLADRKKFTAGDAREIAAWIYGVTKEEYVKMGQPGLPADGRYNPEMTKN